ncbi:MAG: hypothetical protein V7K46_15455 [Nostoc sp.]
MARVLCNVFGKSYEVANTTLIKCAMPAAGYAYAIIPSLWGRGKSVKLCN